MSKKMWFLILFVSVLMFNLSGCSKKQVKTGEEGETAGMDKSKVGVIDIGYSGPMQVVHFEYDKFTLSDEARAVLKGNADWLKKKKNIKVQVEGHCDSRGSQEYNIALGQKRADAVRQYLKDLGVAADRLTTISFGEEKPLDTADNEDAWSNNRRAEFIITDT